MPNQTQKQTKSADELRAELMLIQEKQTTVYWQNEWAKSQAKMTEANATILEMKKRKLEHQLEHAKQTEDFADVIVDDDSTGVPDT